MNKENKKKNFKVKIKSEDKKKKSLWAIFIPVLLVTVLLLGGLYMLGDYFIHKPINEAEEEGSEHTSLNEDVAHPEEFKQKQINILVAGIDSGDRRSTNLTDVMMIANLNLETKQVNILQIPRDTYVDDAVWTGKLNAVYNVGRNDAYGHGINGLMNCINDKFKVHLDYYVLVNLEGFRDIVKAMGGVKITFDEDFTLIVDKKPYHFKKGPQVLTPKEAEVFVRERNSRGGDLGRVQRGQRVFMAALIKQAKEMKKTDLLGMVPTLFKYVRTDMSLADAGRLAGAALDIPSKNITFDMVPGEGVYIKGQSCYTAHLEPLAKIINEKFRVGMDPIAPTDLGLKEVKNTNNYWETSGQTADEVNE